MLVLVMPTVNHKGVDIERQDLNEVILQLKYLSSGFIVFR